jgi:hypothetical protein
LTWARYRGLVVTDKRIADGREAFAANRTLFSGSSNTTASAWRHCRHLGSGSSFGSGTGDSAWSRP